MSDYVITCCSTADMPASYFEEKKVPYACFHFFWMEKNIPMIWENPYPLKIFIR